MRPALPNAFRKVRKPFAFNGARDVFPGRRFGHFHNIDDRFHLLPGVPRAKSRDA
jgi:hypothetical protein